MILLNICFSILKLYIILIIEIKQS